MKREGRMKDAYLYCYCCIIIIVWVMKECGWRGKWGEMMMKEPCDYYSHNYEDAEADVSSR